MDLNHIKLSPFLISELYRTSLIETAEDKVKFQAEKNSLSTEWKCLGNNDKKILIITDYKDAVHIPDTQLDFLTNMLSACKLSLGDVAIVNINNHLGQSYKEFIAFFQSKIILLFGTGPSAFGLPVDFPHFQVQAFSEITYLYTPKLNEMKEDKVLKSKLWVCLRRIFGV